MFIYPVSSVPACHRSEAEQLYQYYYNRGYTLNVSGAIRPGMQIVFAVYVSNGFQFGRTIRHFVIGEFYVEDEKHIAARNVSEFILITASGRKCVVPFAQVESILVLALPRSAEPFLTNSRPAHNRGYQNISDKIACKMYDSIHSLNRNPFFL